VPVQAGARRVDLTFRSPVYERGRLLSILSLLLLAAWTAGTVIWHSRRSRDAGA
jgi:hypothetical protein